MNALKRVAIGIPFCGELGRLSASLASLRANTIPQAVDDYHTCETALQIQSIEVFLLVEANGVRQAAALKAASGIPQIQVPGSGERAACFNCLAAATAADVLIFLENGAQVGPGWLHQMLIALGADSSNGIAGPSTNRCRTLQCRMTPGGEGQLTLDSLAMAARKVARELGFEQRPCESVDEFCMAVRRDVVAMIGPADESLHADTGPQWDADYCARAARVGFRSMWACSAYVHRAPRGKPRLIETIDRRASKPPPLLTRQPSREHKSTDRKSRTINSPRQAVIADKSRISVEPPLISCIMPTRDRPQFARQAIAYFLRQDYQNRELIILDDSIDGGNLAELALCDSRIRLVSLPRGESIGAKRNRGVELARGSIIAQWDDDDWYGPHRLSAQAAPLSAGAADISALDSGVWFDLERWEFWKASESLHRQLFVGDVHGGTLVFRREIWQPSVKYPDRSLAEDAIFLRSAQSRGARLRRINSDGLFVYLRHGKNSWSLAAGRSIGSTGWQRVAEPDFPPADRDFYASLTALAREPPDCLSTNSRAPRSTISDSLRILAGTPRACVPLVSCIMPTADRRRFVRRALQYFFQQDYENRELIVVDDGSDSVADLMPANDLRVRYIDARQAGGVRRSIGAKRNLACAAARGQIILHWDDDDWSSPGRITCQVAHLLAASAGKDGRAVLPDVCGLRCINYYDPAAGAAWQYVYRGRRPWVGGNTLAYRKSLWGTQPFADISVGEDARFLWTGTAKQIADLSEFEIVVGLIHNGANGNVSPKRPGEFNSGWIPRSVDEIRRMLGHDWETFEK
jgi:glycosyltransferase involved in cell wall biosynthesis